VTTSNLLKGKSMATYVLVHGSEHSSWYWHLVVPELEALGHEALAVDLPCDDDEAGLAEYAEVVVDAAGGRRGAVLVGHSLAGFIVPMACERLDASLMVLVAAMVPRPGETAGDWWANTGHKFPEPFDPAAVFAHDLPPALPERSLSTSAASLTGPSGILGPSAPGRGSRPASCYAARTASSRQSSSAEWCVIASGSFPTRCLAGTCRPLPGP
jgi:hypothetical protein